jgi:hypothetical protein
LQLQKSPNRIFGQNSGNSVDISKAFFQMGIWKFESSQVSQAVRLAGNPSLIVEEMPANSGLFQFSERSPGSRGGAKLPKVSGHMPKYSQFWETAAGDWVRSSLRGGRGSAIDVEHLL